MPRRFSNVEDFKTHIYAIMHTRFNHEKIFFSDDAKQKVSRIEITVDAALLLSDRMIRYQEPRRTYIMGLDHESSTWSYNEKKYHHSSRLVPSCHMIFSLDLLLMDLPIIKNHPDFKKDPTIKIMIDAAACIIPMPPMVPNVKYVMRGIITSAWFPLEASKPN